MRPSRSSAAGSISRRDLGRLFGGLAAGPTIFGEHAMAAEAQKLVVTAPGAVFDPEMVFLNRNENPLGPAPEAIEVIAKVARYGGRYHPFDEPAELTSAIAELRGVKETYVQPFAGSGDALLRSTIAFTSPTRSWVMADPGYGNGAPEALGVKTIRVPLRADYSHDAKAMIAADANAGAYYVCNPNNPSGTVTSRQEIDYLLANKSKDAVVIVDEAYIEFSDTAQSAADLVAAGKDVLVLRTFSKVYGMAGIRAGYALARPDLLERLRPFGINFGLLPITAVACATASLRAGRNRRCPPDPQRTTLRHRAPPSCSAAWRPSSNARCWGWALRAFRPSSLRPKSLTGDSRFCPGEPRTLRCKPKRSGTRTNGSHPQLRHFCRCSANACRVNRRTKRRSESSLLRFLGQYPIVDRE